MENTTFWSITGEVVGIGPALSFDGVEMPNKIEVKLKSAGGKLFPRTLGLPAAVPIVMGKRIVVSGNIEMFRSKKTNKDYERMNVLTVADADAVKK
jgi:hypothetical protein